MGNHLGKRPRQRWESEAVAAADLMGGGEGGIEELLPEDRTKASRDGSNALAASSSSKRAEGKAPSGIREITPAQMPVRPAIEPGASPSELSPAQRRIADSVSPAALLSNLDPLLLEVGFLDGSGEGVAGEGIADQSVQEALHAIALGVQVLGQWAAGPAKAQIRRDQRLKDALGALASGAPCLEPWALASALRGFGLLGVTHNEAIGAVVKSVEAKLATIGPSQAAVMLESIAASKGLGGSKVGESLRASVLPVVVRRVGELAVREMASLIPALVRLRVDDEGLVSKLAKEVAASPGTASVHDLAAASAGLAVLRASSESLMSRVSKALQDDLHACSPRAVVHLCTALAERGDPHAFRSHIEPAVRTMMHDFNARDICTIAECFVKAGASSADLLVDLAFTLETKVSDMAAHELSVALDLFASVAYAVPTLLPAVAASLSSRLDELSPRQVVRSLRGLAKSGAGDPSLVEAMRVRVTQLSSTLYGSHAVDALLALVDLDALDARSGEALLRTAQQHLHKMSTSDHIGLLYTVSRLPQDIADAVPVGFDDELVDVVQSRGYGPWRMEMQAIIHLLEALRNLQRYEEEVLELVLDRLPSALRKDAPSLPQLVQLLEILAEQPPSGQVHVRNHLHRRPRLQAALRRTLERPLGRRLDIESEVVLARALAGIGWDEPAAGAWLDGVVALAGVQLECVPPALTCEMCWSLAELGVHRTWARGQARRFLQRRYPEWAMQHPGQLPPTVPSADASDDEDDDASIKHGVAEVSRTDVGAAAPDLAADALLRFTWALAVFNDPLPTPLLAELFHAHGGRLPSDWTGRSLHMLQTLALHHSLSGGLGPGREGAAEGDSAPTPAGAEGKSGASELPVDVREWLELALELPRADLYARLQKPRPERRQRKVKAPNYPYEQWLTIALSQLRIPHEAGKPVANVHRAAAAFRQQKQLIDVLANADLTVPGSRALGGADLRRRQLQQLGWGVHPVQLRELYDAMRQGRMKVFVSKLLSDFDPDAARVTAFRADALHSKVPAARLVGGAVTAEDKAAREATARASWKASQFGMLRRGEEPRADPLKNDEDEDPFGNSAEDGDDGSLGSLRPTTPRGILGQRARQALRLCGEGGAAAVTAGEPVNDTIGQ